MATLKDALLPVVDNVFGIFDQLGFCPYRVFIRVRTWVGPDRIGQGESFTSDTEMTLANSRRPFVELLDQKDVVAPGSPKQMAKFLVGPLTPAYATGGIAMTTLHPAGSKLTEVLYVVLGDLATGLPATGLECKKTKEDLSDPLSIMITLESLGRAA